MSSCTLHMSPAKHPAQTDSDPLLGRVLDGKYTLLSVLGRGGMGVVYRAHQKSLERLVALKLMMGVDDDGDGGESALAQRASEFQRRFFLEAATAAKLKHPNTITVFDYGSADVDGKKVFYITMELLEGTTLSKLLHDGALPPLRAVNIAMQISRSLREAHAAGIVHRDLKPGNVMLLNQDDEGDDESTSSEIVKVLDFGLAKTRISDKSVGPQLTKAGTFLGSPRYVAPEQIEGKPVDARADVYSLGCVLYRMLTGRVPFDGQQAVEVMLKHLNDPVPPLAPAGSRLVIPKSLDDLVMACLAKKAADRPASMNDVLTGLKRARGEILGVHSGNVAIPVDVQQQLLASTTPEQKPPPPPTKPEAQPAPAPLPARAEQTSPSQTVPPKPRLTSSSQPSLNTPSPLSISAEWKIGPAGPEETRPTSGPGGSLLVPRRTPGMAIAAGVVVASLVAVVGIAWRLGKLDDVIASASAWVSPPPPPEPVRAKGPVATAAATARIRVTTEPAGADVFDVTTGAPRLLGITPLIVPWEITIGDPSRELLLKLSGHVPARARVEPPPPSPSGEPVVLEVGATLRAQTPQGAQRD